MHGGKAMECSSQDLTNQSALAGQHPIVLRLGQETVPLLVRKCLHARSGYLERFTEISGSFQDSGQARVGSSLLQRDARIGGLRYDLAVGLERRRRIRLSVQYGALKGRHASNVISQASPSPTGG